MFTEALDSIATTEKASVSSLIDYKSQAGRNIVFFSSVPTTKKCLRHGRTEEIGAKSMNKLANENKCPRIR